MIPPRRERRQVGSIRVTERGDYEAHWNVYVLDPVSGKEVRHHRSRVLPQMTKTQAKIELAKIVAPTNGRPPRPSTPEFELEQEWIRGGAHESFLSWLAQQVIELRKNQECLANESGCRFKKGSNGAPERENGADKCNRLR